MSWLIELLFKCRHNGLLTRPFTREGITYKVCMECGTPLPYNIELFRPMTRKEIRRIEKETGDRRAGMASDRTAAA
jgi:hypothetical protein